MTLAARLSARLSATAHDKVPFAGDDTPVPATPAIAAAVLIAITDRPEPGLILTRRPQSMRRHPGQVAFPGGRIDPGDADAIAAAVREAEEEIALPRAAPQVVATLNPYRTITGFAIIPVLAVIAADLPLVPDAREVAAIFEVPLGFVLDRANSIEQRVEIDGITRRYLEINWGEHRIWGATAAMLANLAARLA
jgi:8-oxo-dGTP pyrophosphatase MutT (NUDIX family)